MKGSSPLASRAEQIRLEHVHVAYPGAQNEALRDISLSIAAGEHVCILGGNGSGKSTLLQLVNALIVPTKGIVRVCGMDTSDPSLALSVRGRTASVFQHPEDQMVTSVVADDVAFGPENLCVPQPQIVDRVTAALTAVSMLDCAQSDPADLSGGQVQRVAIAGALAMEPQIILFDEPCAMLDSEGRSDVRRIIAQLSARGITVLHVTHFMDDALLADRVIALEQGRIVFDGAPSSLFAKAPIVHALGLEMPNSHQEHPAPSLSQVAAESDAAASSDIKGPSRPNANPSIVFDSVSFSYEEASNPRKRTKRRLFDSRHRPQQAVKLALSNLSFQAYPGTLTALIGRTGSGKSTTAELTCALKVPSSGTVCVRGIDTSDLTRRRELRASVGYVAQLPERQLFAETVYDDVAFGPRNLGLSAEEVDNRVREALESVNLTPTDALLESSPFALSGGQQRSVALAGVLAMRQPVLVLDEPMAGLDPQGRRRVRSLLQGLKQKGATLLMVTHSMSDVAELADQVIELDRGKRVSTASPRSMQIPQEVKEVGAAS